MKFPSILKIPEHKRFRLHNRYYDPVKEEIESRTAKIKAELERREKEDSDPSGFESKIAGSFGYNSYSKETGGSGALRFTLMVVLFFGAIGYLYLGNVVLYALIGLVVLIYFLRKRQIL
ncbi:MAG: hypothetical protein HKN67_03450 [Saprospiraceae bacterium]|nr:hypothetical protein [Saprospiraceae bacterium]